MDRRTICVVGVLMMLMLSVPAPAQAQPACGPYLTVINPYWYPISQRPDGWWRIGSTSLFPHGYYIAHPVSGTYFEVEVQIIEQRYGYNPALNMITTSGVTSYNTGPLYIVEGTTYNTDYALYLQTQFAQFDVRVRACSDPTPTPPPTPTPTPTPTLPAGSGGGSGSGGIGGGVSGGDGTPVPAWCGLVPEHPCYVVWATEQAQTEQQTAIALQQTRTLIEQQQSTLLATIAARADDPTPTPYGLGSRQTAEAIAQNGPGPAVGYVFEGSEAAEAYGYQFFVVERYNFGCPVVWENWVQLCVKYVYIKDIQLFPSFYLPTAVFTGALALIVLGFVVRR